MLIFICITTLTVLGLVFFYIHKKKELHIQWLRMKQQEELNERKTNYLTNIIHEFRTPLTLIIGPLRRLLKEDPDEERRRTGYIMLRNAERLRQLVNQVLDIKKIEESKTALCVEKIELVSFISNYIQIFNELTDQKQIDLSYKWSPDRIDVWYDMDMLDKCLNNLLYNAYKFTPAKGKIEVELQQNGEGRAILTISDNGIGIKKEALEYVFNRFYQGDKSQYTGSGIGMYLTKILIELHKGSISVESEEGKGTAFAVTFLLGNTHFKPEELLDRAKHRSVENGDKAFSLLKELSSLPAPSTTLSFAKNPHDMRPVLLLVEDDADMRMYIRLELEDKYQMEEAVNGTDGILKARQLMPDLIITDLMMPEMSGNELCKILKADIETCHIPIIMLTALAGMGHRLEGLETGADSYISKPFSSEYLKARIENLLDIRRKLKERFGKSIDVDAKELVLSSTDERLLQNAIDYIRNNMENADLTVDTMGKDLGISRVHLHRKLKALTGQSPIEFIKTIKMKQAAYLLTTGKFSISEIAYKVGYNTPSYFSVSFNAFFGMSPSAYIEENSKTGKE